MEPAPSLSECAAQLKRALEMRNFSAAQTWLAGYRHRFDQAVQGLAPDEVLRLLSPAMNLIESAQYAALAARSHVAARLRDLARGAAYRDTASRHIWELKG